MKTLIIAGIAFFGSAAITLLFATPRRPIGAGAIEHEYDAKRDCYLWALYRGGGVNQSYSEYAGWCPESGHPVLTAANADRWLK